MNLDRDLADALRPLAGDPVADAARVLAALPPGLPPAAPRGPQPPWAHWLPWTLLVSGLLLGIGLDRALQTKDHAPSTAPTRPPADVQIPREPATQPPPDKPPLDKPPPDPGFLPDRMSDMLEVMAFGPLEVDEPGAGRQQLTEGLWHTAQSTLFKTTRGQAGIYILANDAAVRVDTDSEVRVDVTRIALEFGRVWVDSGKRDAQLRVECGNVKVTLDAAAGIIARAPSGIEVLALSGTIDVDTTLDAVRLAANESVLVDPLRGPRAKVTVPFLAPATSWMTRMIEMGRDQTELVDRVKDVFAAYEKGNFRDAAGRELLKLGSRCVALLADSVERHLASDRDYAIATTQLIARIVDFRTATYVLPLLLQDDAELREIVFHAVRDASGTDADTDEAFWRDAPREQRRTAVDRWRTELSR